MRFFEKAFVTASLILSISTYAGEGRNGPDLEGEALPSSGTHSRAMRLFEDFVLPIQNESTCASDQAKLILSQYLNQDLENLRYKEGSFRMKLRSAGKEDLSIGANIWLLDGELLVINLFRQEWMGWSQLSELHQKYPLVEVSPNIYERVKAHIDLKYDDGKPKHIHGNLTSPNGTTAGYYSLTVPLLKVTTYNARRLFEGSETYLKTIELVDSQGQVSENMRSGEYKPRFSNSKYWVPTNIYADPEEFKACVEDYLY